MTLVELQPLVAAAAALFASGAAAILVWFLVTKPPLNTPVKVTLLFGFGILPIGTAASTNIAGFGHTTRREFCGSCHVMEPWAKDSADPLSTSLAARHAHNEYFGSHNCYECHSDYGAFSTVLTKWGGMLHVWAYYTEFHRYTLEEALPRIHLYKPYVNAACIRCHSAKTPGFIAVSDHSGLDQRLRSGQVSCVSGGCHGPAHPFSKAEQTQRTPATPTTPTTHESDDPSEVPR